MQIYKRLQSIDFLRGLVMLIMVIDHVGLAFYGPPYLGYFEHPTPLDASNSVFFTCFITNYCAPTFIFLAGLSSFLNFQKNLLTTKQAQFFLLKRGLFLIFLEFAVVAWAWIISCKDHIFYAQVIWALGASMCFLALLLYLRVSIILIISLSLILTTNLLDGFTNADHIWWNLLHVKADMAFSKHFIVQSEFPLYPWIGMTGLGYCFGYYLWNERCAAELRKKVLLNSSFACIIAVIILRGNGLYGDSDKFIPSPDFILSLRSFLNVSKSPASLHYLLLTLPLALFILAISENWHNRLVRIIANYGKAPMFYYLAHLLLIMVLRIVADYLIGKTFIIYSIVLIYLISLALIFILYPAVLWFIRFKSQHRQKFPILNYF